MVLSGTAMGFFIMYGLISIEEFEIQNQLNIFQ